MPFGLTIGTERANALQNAIQDELIARGFSGDADPVMAEYITIMIINNKTATQITNELEDLIGSEYDPSFTDWLFQEAAKGASQEPVSLPSSLQPSQPESSPPSPIPVATSRPPHSTRPPPRVPYQVVANPTSSPSAPGNAGNKRTISARSTSPSAPSKARRVDLPTGPRAMANGNSIGNNLPAAPRSLLERVGGRASGGGVQDPVQARIDSIVGASPDQSSSMMMPGAAGPFPSPEMNMKAMQQWSPMMLQEMMMNQMALMTAMGMVNPGAFGMGTPIPGMMDGFQGQGSMLGGNAGRGRGRGKGVPAGRGRGGGMNVSQLHPTGVQPTDATSLTTPLQDASANASTPYVSHPTVPTSDSTAAIVTASTPVTAPTPARPSAPPMIERPISPTLCKFGMKCTNGWCRYSHPSPVATLESGVVLSNEPCEMGRACTDPDCVRGHVSPAARALGAGTGTSSADAPISGGLAQVPSMTAQPKVATVAAAAPPAATTMGSGPQFVACRFGASCTKPSCPYVHPSPAAAAAVHHNPHHFTPQHCRFGAACTRPTCPFVHPPGRVLGGGGEDGASPSHNRSVKFNHPSSASGSTVKERLEAQMKEIEEKKKQAEEMVKAAQAERRQKQGQGQQQSQAGQGEEKSAGSAAAVPLDAESKGVLTIFTDVSFPQMRAALGHYYVDKTELIEKLITMRMGAANLVLRPRRCGKSTMLSLLRSFFSLNEPNQKHWFEGLYIASKHDICKEHMGQYAVINLDLKNINGQTWETMQDGFGKAISDLYQTWAAYLRGSLDQQQSREYNSLISRSSSTGDLQSALTSLSSLLAKKSGRGVVVLLDEYDAPINCAFENGYLDQANKYFGQAVFLPLLKGNPHVRFAVLAGVSPTARSGWFSGLNSLEMHPLHARNSIYAGRVMFTEPEVERLRLLSQSPLGLDDLKAHYNSYLAGGTISVYNPVSIIQALRTGKIDNYWVATGRYPLLTKSLTSFDTDTLESFEKLLKGEEVITTLKKDVHFNLSDLDCSGVLTSLYYGGYLSVTASGGLTIPNLDVLADWSLWITDTEPVGKNIFSLCAKGPVSAFETQWPIFMQSTLHPKLVAKPRGGSRRTPERLYHVYLLGLLHGLRSHGWVANVEGPSGLGYIDIRIFSKAKRAGVLIELKTSVKSEQLDGDADKALRQIIDKNYRSKLTYDGAQYIREYGIACFHLESKVKGRYMVRSGDSWLESPDPATREDGD